MFASAPTREAMSFKRLSRRHPLGSRGWSALEYRRRSGRPSSPIRSKKTDLQAGTLVQLSERLLVGNGHISLSDRGGRERRRAGPIDLGPFRPHARDNLRSQQCRHHGCGSLSSVQARHSVDEGVGSDHHRFSIAWPRVFRKEPARQIRKASISMTGCWTQNCQRTA